MIISTIVSLDLFLLRKIERFPKVRNFPEIVLRKINTRTNDRELELGDYKFSTKENLI